MQTARGTAITAQQQDVPTERRRLKSRVLFAVVALVGLGLDAGAKALAVRYLDPTNPTVLAGGLLRLQLIRNSGAAFSLGENFTIVFAVLSVLVLAFVLIKLVPRIAHRGWAVAVGLLTAGVCGNLADRIFRAPSFLHGRVVDFLELPHWPIFNVADMCITSAAVLIVVLAIVKNVGLDGVRHPGSGTQAGPERAQAPGPSVDRGADQPSPAGDRIEDQVGSGAGERADAAPGPSGPDPGKE